jgi:hypothetical protein
MTIRYEFERDAGYRFYNGDVSLLLHAFASLKERAIATNVDLNNIFRRINKYLQTVSGYSPEQQGFSRILSVDEFSKFEDTAFYKFLPNTSLEYIMADSFQFGSIEYYRNVEAPSSKDTMEGLSNLVFSTPRRLICISLASGYNYCIFCGTSRLDNSGLMSKRFGPNIIKIAKLRPFAEEAKSILGAKRVFLSRVIYNDLKLFRTKTMKSLNVTTPSKDNFSPEAINENFFDFLYDSSFLSSLFMKPTRFSPEQELRLVFEMPKDVPNALRVGDKGLLKHVEFIS